MPQVLGNGDMIKFDKLIISKCFLTKAKQKLEFGLMKPCQKLNGKEI
jgi:hypothetical protein